MNMTTVYIHIGTHKTGTTSIQRVLMECQNRLRSLDVLFPVTGKAMGSVHQLAWCYLDNNPEWYPVSSLSASDLYTQLRDEINESACSKVILSSEDFSFIDINSKDEVHALHRLKDSLAEYNVKVIVYLRPQSDYLTAFYNQVHKAYDSRFPDKSVKGLEKSLQGVLNYDQLLSRWASVFGNENIIVRPFNERKAEGDLVQDFLKVCGVSLQNIPVIKTNESLDPELLAFRRMINDYPSSDVSKVALEHLLSAISQNKPAPIFSSDEALALMERYEEGNQKVAELYLNTVDANMKSLSLKNDDDHTNLDDALTWKKSVQIMSTLLGEMSRELSDSQQKQRQAVAQAVAQATFQHVRRTFSFRRKLSALLGKERRIISRSDYFDARYYLAENPDVAVTGMDPIDHYLRFGALEGRNPSRNFETSAYLADNMDAAFSGINPLVHYIKHGCSKYGKPCNNNKFTENFYDTDSIRCLREKSLLGCHIVVIDHEIPRFEQSAGARHTLHYLKLLVDLGAAVTLLPFMYSEEDVSNEIKVLREAGINVLEHGDCFNGAWKPDLWLAWLNYHRDQIDIVFIHRPHIANVYMAYCKNDMKVPVWYMCHDLHFMRLKRQAWIEKNPKIALKYLWYKVKEKAIFKMADINFTPSVFEEEYVKQHFDAGTVVTLPLYIYEDLDSSARIVPDGKIITFVGSFGHAPNVDAVSWFTVHVMPLIVKSDPTAEFHVIGSNPPEDLLALATDNVIFHGYLSDAELESFYEGTRVVVIPLRYGAGVKGKVIEAMAMGIPFVSTACGIEGIESLEDVVNARDSAGEFAAEVSRLLNLCVDDDADLSVCLKKIAGDKFSVIEAENLIRPCLDQCSDRKKNIEY